MARKCARRLSGARPSVSADAIQPPRREGRVRAVAGGVRDGPAMVSSAGRRPSRWVDRELLGEAIDPWPLLVQTLCSFVDRDRTPRWTGGGPTTGPAVNR